MNSSRDKTGGGDDNDNDDEEEEEADASVLAFLCSFAITALTLESRT